jgi:hypothetical protein
VGSGNENRRTIIVDVGAGFKQIVIYCATGAAVLGVLVILSIEQNTALYVVFAAFLTLAIWNRQSLTNMASSLPAIILNDEGLYVPRWGEGIIPWTDIRRVSVDNIYGEICEVRVHPEDARVIEIHTDDDDKIIQKMPSLRRKYSIGDKTLGRHPLSIPWGRRMTMKPEDVAREIAKRSPNIEQDPKISPLSEWKR